MRFILKLLPMAVGIALAFPASGSTKAGNYAQASWYGPGLYGNTMACGGRLGYNTVGVAHKYMRCGTKLTICYRGCVRVTVVDRGPYVRGREFDLTAGAARIVGLSGVRGVSWHYGW